jgi:hypothetical protein
MASCTFTQSSKLSAKISTVGIVTWSTTLSNVKSAKIDFGVNTSYGHIAPVTTPSSSGDNTTLLLGMKQGKVYHYRITVSSDAGDCVSDDYTMTSGKLPNGLPAITVTTKNATALFGGYLLIGQYVQTMGTTGAPAYIVDGDGDIVWAYYPGQDVGGLVMSYDGSHVWTNSNNVPNKGATVHRVSVDGTNDQDLSSKFTGQSHQLTVLPDETVSFYAYASSGCEDIKEYAPDGTVRTVVNGGTAQGQSSGCHLNNIQYSKDDDTLVYSDLYHQTVVKVRRSDGSTVWILNGNKSTFTGDSWQGGQHGIHLLGLDDLLIFNNNGRSAAGGGSALGGTSDGSMALELKLNLVDKKASKMWSYKAGSALQVDILGDLQRLPNGNTLVGYSTAGVTHEVDANGTLLQQMSWPLGSTFGYIQKRATLYGPPPR